MHPLQLEAPRHWAAELPACSQLFCMTSTVTWLLRMQYCVVEPTMKRTRRPLLCAAMTMTVARKLICFPAYHLAHALCIVGSSHHAHMVRHLHLHASWVRSMAGVHSNSTVQRNIETPRSAGLLPLHNAHGSMDINHH